MKPAEIIRARLSRRVGSAFADMAIAANAAYGYPDGWGTSGRRAPKAKANPQVAALKVPSKAYKPTHGGYPDAKPRNN